MDQAIRRQFAYNGWANRRVAISIRTVTGSSERARKLFSHVLNAERLWLCRILGENGPLPWDDRSLDECDRLIEENDSAYAGFFDSERATDDRRMVDYRTTDGSPFRTLLGDILRHILMHGCYHRGQIASAVKAEGGEPATTDFILYLREMGLDAE